MVDCLRDMDLSLTVVDVIKNASITVLYAAIYRLVSTMDGLRSLHSKWRGGIPLKTNAHLRWLLDLDRASSATESTRYSLHFGAW